MRFTSDRQRKAVFANLSATINRFSMSDDIIKRHGSSVGIDSTVTDFKRCKFSEDSRKKNFQAYDMWDTGMSIPEVAKSMGISEGAVRAAIIGYGVDPAFIGYKSSDAIDYYKEIEGLDISEDESKSLLDKMNKGEDFHDLLEFIRVKPKKSLYGRDEDERSSDYVSKAEWSMRPVFSKKKREKGYTETVDGYECDYCGDEFSTKAAAMIHSSVCRDKEDEAEYNDDDLPIDNFFSNDDGTI